MRSFLADLLGEQWDVEALGDAEQALRSASARVPDLVISDIVMPGFDGLQLLRALRKEPRTRTVPVILLSARTTDDERIEGLEIGADDYLGKPFSARELVARVRSHLELTRLRRRAEEEACRAAELLERKVEERTAELYDTVRELELVAYTVAHDLRAPLRAMRGLSDILLDDCADRLDLESRAHLHRIADAASRMDKLIEDLLEYTRVSRSHVRREPVDLGGLVTDVLGELEAELRSQHATVDVVRPLPAILGQRIFLRQILINLIRNAAKFVAAGVEPRIVIRAGRTDGGVRVWIEDNGIGIAPEHQRRIFQVFERLHRPGAYPGTGIGLAIVHRGIERMGGCVGVESRPGAGSCFWFELPAP